MAGVLEDIGNRIVETITYTLTRFTAFIFLVFTIGMILGWQLTQHLPHVVPLAVLVSLGVAVLAYMSPAFAVVSFIIFFILIFIL